MNVLDRIRKLLALSKSANRHEAQLAFENATRLMALHRFELRDVVDPPLLSLIQLRPDGWELGLLSAIASSTGTVLVLGGRTVHLYAFDQVSLDSASAMFSSLRSALQRMAKLAWKEHVIELTDPQLGTYPSVLEPGAMAEWTDSWLVGVVVGFHERLQPVQEHTLCGTEGLVHIRRPQEALRERVRKDLRLSEDVGEKRAWADGVTLAKGSFIAGREAGKTL